MGVSAVRGSGFALFALDVVDANPDSVNSLIGRCMWTPIAFPMMTKGRLAGLFRMIVVAFELCPMLNEHDFGTGGIMEDTVES